MIKRFLILILVGICGLLLGVQFTYAQERNAEDLFQQARKWAFEEKQYDKAKHLAKEALQLAPDYTDIQIFLGRLHIWGQNTDSARMVFSDLALNQTKTEDFFVAYATLEIQDGRLSDGLKLIEEGLTLYPESEDLENLKKRLRSNSYPQYPANNGVGIAYNYIRFNNKPEGNWHMLTLQYQRLTRFGPIILKGNFVNKFDNKGAQVEIEAYPRLSPMFYLYVGAGYSDNDVVFPKFRSGLSLYANLPFRLEGELGFRQLYFTENIMMYTASLGQYYENFWYNIRAFIGPNQDRISQSYAANVRYYPKGALDYWGLQIGTGIEPDDSRINLLADPSLRIKTFRLGADYQFSLQEKHVINLSATHYWQKFSNDSRSTQADLKLSYVYYF